MPNEEDTEITRSSISKATSYEEIGEFWDNPCRGAQLCAPTHRTSPS
jgi:hypothetical protein